LIAPEPKIKFVTACGKKYLMGLTLVKHSSQITHYKFNFNFQMLYKDAASFCCQYGLKLASASTAEITCIVATSYGKYLITNNEH